ESEEGVSGGAGGSPVLLDHLVGAGEERGRHVQSKRFGGLQIDRQRELGRLHDRQVRRFLALEDTTAIDAGSPIRIREIGAVTEQSSQQDVLTKAVARGYRLLRGEPDDERAPAVEERLAGDNHSTDMLCR